MVYHKIYHALWQVFHFAWYITKYTTHFNNFFTLRGISQNIPRKVKNFTTRGILSPLVEYFLIFLMCDGNDNIIPSFWSFKTNIIFNWLFLMVLRVLVVVCHFKALFYISHGISQNIPRILTSFAFCVVYHKIYHAF